MSGYDIGWAVAQMKAGHKVCRPGWNGKGMWLKLLEADVFKRAYGYGDYRDCVVMKTADDHYQPGWLASQPDLLATDWELAE